VYNYEALTIWYATWIYDILVQIIFDSTSTIQSFETKIIPGLKIADERMTMNTIGESGIRKPSSFVSRDTKRATESFHDPGPANRDWTSRTNVVWDVEE
jgi:hypothetical protein